MRIAAARVRLVRKFKIWLMAGRDVSVLDDDVMVVSYPRSGNTWTRFLIANLLDPATPASFLDIERRVPSIYHLSDWSLSRLPRPRVLKSHEYFDPRYRKVLYLVRDPRDVAVSYYYYMLRMRQIVEADGMEPFLDAFLSGAVDGYGSWGEHVGGWMGARYGDPDFLVVRYEDLRARPQEQMARIAKLLGRSTDPATLDRAIEASSFDQMQKLERSAGKQWINAKLGRSDISFVREGSVGHGTSQLPAPALRRIEQAWAWQLAELGYAPATAAQSVGSS